MYPNWRGGYYYAARPKGDPAAPLALLYVSRWSNTERASQFAAIYAKALAKRYTHVHDVAENGKDPAVQTAALEKLTGKRTWLTEEGPVVIEAEGYTVLIVESVDQPATEKLEQEVFGTPVTAAK
jgi:hypothetical protein